MATTLQRPPETLGAIGRPAGPPAGGRWVVVVGCLGLVALAVWNTVHKSLWTDEAYSLLTANQSIAWTWHQALWFELQPPLYFLLLNLWLHAGTATVEWARILSTLCVLGSVFLLSRAARPTRAGRGIPAPILAAVTATFVWAAAEARGYGLALLLSSATYYLFLRIVTGRSQRPTRDAAWYAVIAYLGLMTMYYTGFVLLGQWAAAMVVRRGRVRLTAALAVCGVAMLPWVPVVLSQVGGHANLNQPFGEEVATSTLPGGAVAILSRDFLGAIFAASPMLDRPNVAIGVAVLLLLVLAIRLAAVVRARSPRLGTDDRAHDTHRLPGIDWGDDETVLTIAVAVPAICLLALRVTNATLVWPRHMAALAPGVVLLWSIWTARAPAGLWSRLSAGALLLVCLTTLISYERHADVADSRGAARYVAARGAAGEPVLVVGPEAVFAFRYYYRADDGRATVRGVPQDASLRVYDPDAGDLTDTTQIEARLGAGAQPGRSLRDVWFVVSKRFVWHSATAAAVFERYLRAHAVQRDSIDFTNLYVVHAALRQ